MNIAVPDWVDDEFPNQSTAGYGSVFRSHAFASSNSYLCSLDWIILAGRSALTFKWGLSCFAEKFVSVMPLVSPTLKLGVWFSFWSMGAIVAETWTANKTKDEKNKANITRKSKGKKSHAGTIPWSFSANFTGLNENPWSSMPRSYLSESKKSPISRRLASSILSCMFCSQPDWKKCILKSTSRNIRQRLLFEYYSNDSKSKSQSSSGRSHHVDLS